MAESFDHPGRVLLAFPSTGHDISTRFMRSFWELDVWDRERAVQVWEALGEDVSFCLRAGEQGHKVYVDTTAHVGHHKGGRVYWPEDTKTMGVQPPEEPKLTDDNART